MTGLTLDYCAVATALVIYGPSRFGTGGRIRTCGHFLGVGQVYWTTLLTPANLVRKKGVEPIRHF